LPSPTLPQLPEREEWNKSHENDQTPASNSWILSKEANETSSEPFPIQAFDHMLDESKADDKETENKSPEKGGINQGLLSKAATERRHLRS